MYAMKSIFKLHLCLCTCRLVLELHVNVASRNSHGRSRVSRVPLSTWDVLEAETLACLGCLGVSCPMLMSLFNVAQAKPCKIKVGISNSN